MHVIAHVGVMARDGKEKGIEAVVTDDSDHRKFFDVRLDRYDKKTEFYMRGYSYDHLLMIRLCVCIMLYSQSVNVTNLL